MVLCFCYFKITLNLTSSMPYGFYAQSNNQLIRHDDYISFCLTAKYVKIGLEQGYLEPGYGCPGTNSKPLIKKVIGLPFESVELTDSRINVNGLQINAATKYVDSSNRPLTIFARGTYRQNCYWVIGDNDIKHSWDSRYWGCIAPNQIITKIKPLLTW